MSVTEFEEAQAGGNVYAVADLHGRADLLQMALHAIEADARAPATVIFLGDYVGKGGETAAVLDRLLAGPPAGWRWVCLKGNHEAMMQAALAERLSMQAWKRKGGKSILASYPASAGEGDAACVPTSHRDWIAGLSTIHVDRHRVFVHAGVDPRRPLDDQHERDLLWKRYDDGDGRGHAERFVVHGHHPHEDGPLVLSHRMDLDTLAWSTGRLVVAVFEAGRPGPPIRFIEVKGRPKGRRASKWWRALRRLLRRCAFGVRRARS